MGVNQIGALTAGKMKTFRPELSSDVDIQPGHTEKWGVGFLINTAQYEGGRSAGFGLGWTLQHVLLDRSEAVGLRRHPDAVSAVRRQGEPLGSSGDFGRAVYRAALG